MKGSSTTPPATPGLDSPAGRGRLAPRVARQLTDYVLPLGLFVVLTGMIWSGDRSLYHQLFYWLLALPAFVLTVTSRAALAQLAKSPVFIAFAAFAAYTALSVTWTGSDDGTVSLLKRPLYVLLLFVAVVELGRIRPDRLALVLRAAAIVAVAGAAISLALFTSAGIEARLAGFGALHNPLLTSHVFGFFLALWIAYWISRRTLISPITIAAVGILGAVILATGSRTPLVALTATVLWLAALAGDRRGLFACVVLVSVGMAVIAVWPEVILQRGASYRPQIWAETLRQIAEQPFIGHGYDHPLRVNVEGLGIELWDPHNMTLAVLYQGGAMGLILWVTLYGTAFVASWRARANPIVFILSAPLVYGLVAGMTEGGSFLPRPKEHWFLIWIPLALVAAVTRSREHGR